MPSEIDQIYKTFDSYFCKWNNNNIKSIKNKTVPNKFITILYKLGLEYSFILIMFGDTNQCNPIEGKSQVCYNYINSISVRQICPALQTLEYIENCSRHDMKTKNVLDFFLKKAYVSKLKRTKDGKLIFNPITKSYRNTCYLNKRNSLWTSMKEERAINKQIHDWIWLDGNQTISKWYLFL